MASLIDYGPTRRSHDPRTHQHFEPTGLRVPKNIERRPIKLPPMEPIKDPHRA